MGKPLFDPAELEAMRLADEEIDREFEEKYIYDRTNAEIDKWLDKLAVMDALDHRQAKAKARQAAYRAEHKDEIAAYQAAYRAEHKDEIAAYYAEHKDEIAAYRAEHKDEIAAYMREYRKRKLWRRNVVVENLEAAV